MLISDPRWVICAVGTTRTDRDSRSCVTTLSMYHWELGSSDDQDYVVSNIFLPVLLCQVRCPGRGREGGRGVVAGQSGHDRLSLPHTPLQLAPANSDIDKVDQQYCIPLTRQNFKPKSFIFWIWDCHSDTITNDDKDGSQSWVIE